MSKVRFFRCEHCEKIVGVIKDTPASLMCCGEAMKELVANTTDAAAEKHVPVISVDGNIVTVKIGEVDHPMMEEHYIEWIYIRTQQGAQRKALNPGDAPEATFALVDGDAVIEAYEYCNLHGLWVAEV